MTILDEKGNDLCGSIMYAALKHTREALQLSSNPDTGGQAWAGNSHVLSDPNLRRVQASLPSFRCQLSMGEQPQLLPSILEGVKKTRQLLPRSPAVPACLAGAPLGVLSEGARCSLKNCVVSCGSGLKSDRELTPCHPISRPGFSTGKFLTSSEVTLPAEDFPTLVAAKSAWDVPSWC